MTLAFISFHGWDARQKRYVVYSVGTMGGLQVSELEWLDDDTVISFEMTREGDQRFIDRWTTKLGKDESSFVGERCGATGRFWKHITGRNVRAKDGKPFTLDAVGTFMGPPAQPMGRLRRLAGRYAVEGEYTMAAGQKGIPFSGTERIRTLFGGHVVETVARGGEGYEGYGALVWNGRAQRYDRFEVNSWGMHHTSEGHWADDRHLVFAMRGEFMGRPTVSRSVLEIDKEGHVVSHRARALIGAGPPFESFVAVYARDSARSGGR